MLPKMDFDFNTQFYELKGTLVGERKANFRKLLYSTDPLTMAQQLNVTPRNCLETIFYVDALIYSRQTDKLVKILQEGNGMYISRIMKQKWFFEEAFKDMTEDYLVNTFLSTLSYSIRMKVLKKLALTFTEDRMNKLFDNLFERYGLFIAKQFLFACSTSKIIEVLKNNTVTLSDEQIKRLLEKDIDLMKVYVEEYQRNTGIEYYNKHFLTYLIRKHPYLYFELKPQCEKYGVKVGRQTTKSILEIDKLGTLKELEDDLSKKSICPFNISTITRKVEEFDKYYLSKIFPTDIKDWSSHNCSSYINIYIEKFPKRKRWSVLSTAFKQAYNENIEDHLSLFNTNLKWLIPDELVNKWAEIKFRLFPNEFDYLKYFSDFEIAFKLLKEKINVTSDVKCRGNLLSIMIELASSRNNYKPFEEVLEYICRRHRNDDVTLTEQILRKIASTINYELSTEKFWTYINQLVNLFRIKGQALPFENISQYLIYVFKKETVHLRNIVRQYVNDTANQRVIQWNFAFFSKEPQIYRNLIFQIVDNLDAIEVEKTRISLTSKLMKNTVDFNLANADYWIDLNDFPIIKNLIARTLSKVKDFDANDITCIQSLIRYNFGQGTEKPLLIYEDSQLVKALDSISKSQEAYKMVTCLLEAIKQWRKPHFPAGLLECFLTSFYPNHCGTCERKSAITYLIKKEPELLHKYYNQILASEVDKEALNYSSLIMYSHLGLDRRFVDYFAPLVSMESTCKSYSKNRFISALSKIMSSEDFLRLISVYIPQTAKMNISDLESNKFYEIQCNILKSLKNLSNLQVVVPYLNIFCQGDYFQPSRSLLYKVLCHINEQFALKIIADFSDKAVSVRKHSVVLAFELLPQQTALELLHEIIEKETNVSSKEYLFKAMQNNFLKNPSDHNLKLVLKNMAFIDQKDQLLFQNVIDSIHKVPVKFRPVVIKRLWEYLEVLEEEIIIVHKRKLLSLMESSEMNVFQSLKIEFCQAIIGRYFLSGQESKITSNRMYLFVLKYLLASPDDERFKFVFDIIKQHKDINWGSDEMKVVFHFFARVFNSQLTKTTEFLQLFKKYWEKLFALEESFCEHVLLLLMTLYDETSNMADFCKELSKTFQDFISKYGPYINDMLLKCVETFIFSNNFKYDKFKLAKFALQLITTDKNDLNCFIVSNIVAKNYNKNNDEIWAEIIASLRTINDFSVKVRCNQLFTGKMYNLMS